MKDSKGMTGSEMREGSAFGREPASLPSHGAFNVTEADLRRYIEAQERLIVREHGASCAVGGEARWYAVHTKARSEMLATEHLRRQGFAVFYPHESVTVKHGRRVIGVMRPFLPRYMFARFGLGRLHTVNGTIGVSVVVNLPGYGPLSIPDAVIEALMRRCDERGKLIPTEAELVERAAKWKVGQNVRITMGPFADFLAVIDTVKDETVRLWVDLFGQRTPMTVDAAAIEVSDHAAASTASTGGRRRAANQR